MQVAQYLKEDQILLNAQSRSKEDLLREMVAHVSLENPDFILSKVWERETVRSTGFGRGLAVAHARIDHLNELVLIVARPAEPVDWNAMDQLPVQFVVLVLGPDALEAEYLKVLAEVTKIWSRKESRALLLSAQNIHEVVNVIAEAKTRSHPR